MICANCNRDQNTCPCISEDKLGNCEIDAQRVLDAAGRGALQNFGGQLGAAQGQLARAEATRMESQLQQYTALLRQNFYQSGPQVKDLNEQIAKLTAERDDLRREINLAAERERTAVHRHMAKMFEGPSDALNIEGKKCAECTAKRLPACFHIQIKPPRGRVYCLSRAETSRPPEKEWCGCWFLGLSDDFADSKCNRCGGLHALADSTRFRQTVGDAVAIPYFIAVTGRMPKALASHAWDTKVTPDTQAHCWTIDLDAPGHDVKTLARALFDLEMRGEASKIAEVNLADRAGSGLALIEGDQKIRNVLQTMWERTKVDVRTRCLARAQEIVEAMQP
jgi:hypothetical protein